MKKKVAIIGTQGIPSQYGGFETLVDFLAEHLAQDFDITIFCSAKHFSHEITNYKNCNLVYVALNANGLQSIFYDMVCMLRSYKTFDKILILGASGGVVFPFLRKYSSKFILNFGGLDWKRSKWGYFTRKFLKLSEYLAVKNSALLIADNVGIQEYISREYQRASVLIEYGGDQVQKVSFDEYDQLRYSFLKSSYAFSVARIQPDNNIEMIIEAFLDYAIMPLVLVGNWANSSYGKMLRRKFLNCPNVFLLDAIYDATELNKLRSNCKIYIHGHSAGGTNPALVEAMSLGLPVIAYASGFNEFTTEGKAVFFQNKIELCSILNSLNEENFRTIGVEMRKVADSKYRWRFIANKYKNCLNS